MKPVTGITGIYVSYGEDPEILHDQLRKLTVIILGISMCLALSNRSA